MYCVWIIIIHIEMSTDYQQFLRPKKWNSFLNKDWMPIIYTLHVVIENVNNYLFLNKYLKCIIAIMLFRGVHAVRAETKGNWNQQSDWWKKDIYIHYTCSLFVKCMSCFLRTTCAQARINPGTNVDIVRIVPMPLLSFRQFINGDK